MKVLRCRVLVFGGVQVAVLAAAGAALGHAEREPARAGDAVVLEWNAIAVDTIGATAPPPAARFMAITQIAVFEAVDAITGEYEPYLGTVTAPPGASVEAAAIAAAHDVLAELFPGAAQSLDDAKAASLLSIGDGQAKEDGIVVGQEAAAALLAERTGDGSETPEFYVPPDTDAGRWQPTPSCTEAGGSFLYWQDVEPFGLVSSSQFRADPPFSLTSASYAYDLNEVRTLGAAASTSRPVERANVALLYAAQAPHVGWNSIARQLATVRSDGIGETARTLALLNASLNDALVAVFESKYHYTFWRPQTAIARADEDGNEQTAPDAAFTPFIVAPCHPSYPSGHGSAAGACSTVLAAAYGDGPHELVNTTPTLPEVVLHYTHLHQIVRDVSDARVYGGIHFRNDQNAAERLGSEVARYDVEQLFGRLACERESD